jgi:MFS family permease
MPQPRINVSASRLFLASRFALVVTAMSFALRGAAGAAWTAQFHLSNEQLGWINGTAFGGFTLAMMFGGPLCDALGLGRILGFAFVGHLAGICLTIFAWNYASLYCGTLIFGIANGAVEAACNPLIATVYAAEKTKYLNRFHVWFPGGIVVGGLWAYLAENFGLGWQIEFAAMLVPLAIYGFLFAGQSFPQTERVQRGVSTAAMFRACLDPWFLLMVGCMLLTAATELGPNQWIPTILARAGVSGILVLVWITGLMAVGRQCAGMVVHRLSPLAMLIGSSLLSAAGLFALSRSHGAMLFAAATLFAIGVCFYWPTMLAFVNERLPQTGALGLAIMGGAGMLSVNVVLPIMGRFYDRAIAARLPAGATVPGLSAAAGDSDLGALWVRVQADAGLQTLGRVAVLPLILAAVFAAMRLFSRRSASGTVPEGPA